jgi:hypothetical protein
MFEDWQAPSSFKNCLSTCKILTAYGVYVDCILDPFYMTLYTHNDGNMYHKPTLNGQPLTRAEFEKFKYYRFYRSMIRCDNPRSLVIWLSRRVKDSGSPGETLRIIMQQVDAKRKADGDIDFVATNRLLQYPRV